MCAGALTPLSAAVDGGKLDAAFGAGSGKVTIDLAGDDVVRDVAVQDDGRIVAVGDYGTGPTTSDIIVLRLLADGSIDPSFAGGKAIQLDLGKEDRGNAVALQPDGKIVVAGTGRGNFAVLRFLSSGALDAGFGSGGLVLTDIGHSEDRAFGVAIQGDGKIVAAGRTSTSNGPRDFAVVRYKADGSLDGGFGTGGIARTDFGGDDRVEDLAIGPDGRIVVVGGQLKPATAFAVARYNTNGSLDASFDGDGKLLTDFGATSDHAYGVVVQRDGKTVVSGETGGNLAVVRYGVDGGDDTSFHSDGRAIVDFGGDERGHDVTLQPNGKVIVAGAGGPASDFIVVRLRTDGTLDQSFATGGIASADFGREDVAWSVTVQDDGKVLAAGTSSAGGNGDFAFARLLRGFCLVPRLVGKTLVSARAALVTSGCSLGKVGRGFSKKIKKGRIISQRPAAGTKLDEDAAVAIVLSRGRRR